LRDRIQVVRRANFVGTKFGGGGKRGRAIPLRRAPPTPFLFARLLGLRPQNFSADEWRDRKKNIRPCPTLPMRGRQGTPFY